LAESAGLEVWVALVVWEVLAASEVLEALEVLAASEASMTRLSWAMPSPAAGMGLSAAGKPPTSHLTL
jgi:hypothetical protein